MPQPALILVTGGLPAGDRSALKQLGAAMAEIATDPDRARDLIATAAAAGFTFDD